MKGGGSVRPALKKKTPEPNGFKDGQGRDMGKESEDRAGLLGCKKKVVVPIYSLWGLFQRGPSRKGGAGGVGMNSHEAQVDGVRMRLPPDAKRELRKCGRKTETESARNIIGGG